MEIAYKAEVTAEGGRTGHVKSSDGLIDFDITTPKEMGGKGGATNPEQLFAAGYAACFGSALAHVARSEKIAIGKHLVTATVGIGPNGAGGFALEVALAVQLPELAKSQAEHLVEIAHRVCPYSNATRGNIPVSLQVTAHA